jgi:regulator of replication initiation timing
VPTPIHREPSANRSQNTAAAKPATRAYTAQDKAPKASSQPQRSQRSIQKGTSPKPPQKPKPKAPLASAFPVLKKRLTGFNNTVSQDSSIYEDLKGALDTHLAKAFDKILQESHLEPSALEDKYKPEAIALLLDKLLQSLNFHSKNPKDKDLSGLDSLANRLLKDFVKQQDSIFKRHFPWLQGLISHKKEAKGLECTSIKDLIQIVNASANTPESPYKKSLGLILSTDLSASLILIAIQKLKKSASSQASTLLYKQLSALKERIDKLIEEFQTLPLESPPDTKTSKLTKAGSKLPLSPETSHAFKEELLRSKRFILSLEDTLARIESDGHSYTKRLELWAQQDIKAFLEVLDDKIRIARCIGDKAFEAKLGQLKGKFYLYSTYPNTLKLGLNDIEAQKLDPEALKTLLFKQFMQSLETIGHEDPYLAHKVEQKYLKSAGSLELAFKKIFWVPYPQLKAAIGTFLEKFKEMEAILGAIDQLPPGALRNKKSYIRNVQDLLTELKQLEPKLSQSLKQAKEKAHSKAISLDPIIENFVKNLQASLPTTEQLRASGYSPE